MRCVIQRVTEASVKVSGETVGQIGKGFMVLIGVSTEDTDKDLKYMAEKVPNLRIFEDEQGKMNLSLKDVGGAILAGYGVGIYPSISEAARKLVKWDKIFQPNEANHLVYEAMYEPWRKVYQAQLALADQGLTKHMWIAPMG